MSGCGIRGGGGRGGLVHLASSAERGFGEGRGLAGHDSETWHSNRAGKPEVQESYAKVMGCSYLVS